MNLKSVDLNLLVVFDAVYEHRSMTHAGQTLGLSQPAMSSAMNRLRTLFNDPLFVRRRQTMQPTPRATELAEPVSRVLSAVRDEILPRAQFDPIRAKRVFTLVTPDIGEAVFIPPLVAHLAAAAPYVRLRTLAMSAAEAALALESGEAELAIGYFPDLHKAGFFQQQLFDDQSVACMMRAGHPLANTKLSLQTYMSANHIVVKPDGRAHVFEQFMEQQGLQRNVQVELSHFMSVLPLIECSDLIATVPRRIAELCARYSRVRVLDVPLKAPRIAVHQFWHRRCHKDLANAWLRGVIQELFGAKVRRRTRAK